MPFERIGHRALSASSHVVEEICISPEIEPGPFWNSKTMHQCHVGSPTNVVLLHKASDAIASCCKEGPFRSKEDSEAKIGNLLPEEDDLFSGVIEELEGIAVAKVADNAEAFDLFSNAGGFELEIDEATPDGHKNSDFTERVTNDQVNSNDPLVSADIYDEHLSRTLFVRNISSNIGDSDLRALFKQYGDIRTLYTACKHRGFVIISYFDIRASSNAMKELQNKLLGHQKLDIHYSIPKDNQFEKEIKAGMVVICSFDSSILNYDLRQIFGIYGDIRKIHETLHKCHHKFIEFYDVRAAEAARQALKFGIARQRIKLGPSCQGGTSLMRKCSMLEQNEGTVSHGGKSVGCSDNGPVKGLNSAVYLPVDALAENAFTQGTSYLLNLSSPLRVASSGNHCFDLHKPRYSLDQVNFEDKCIPTFHPHFFADSQDSFNISSVDDFYGRVQSMTGKIGPRASDRTNCRPMSMGSGGQPMQLKGEAFSTSGHQWSNANSFDFHRLSPSLWPNSPLFSNSLNAACLSELPGFSGVPFNRPNSISSPQHLFVGSAPSVSPLIGDGKHPCRGESPKVSAFCLGSLGSVGLYSSYKMPLVCPGQNNISTHSRFGFPHECERKFSHRRNQSNSSHADKKQFELDIDRILRGEDSRTTLMIRNIPNKYTSKMLLAAIDEHCQGTYDFIYLPIDFQNKCNVGYAFVNLIDPHHIIPFYKAFNGKKWEKFNSEKVVALAYARIQGKVALIAHFQNSSLMNEDKWCRPILFCTDGPNAGEQEPFPTGPNVWSRVAKA